MATTDLGKVSVVPKGAWSAVTAYEALDIVTNGGSTWLAKKASTNVTPVEGEYWMFLVSNGTNGTDGEDGDDGVGIASIVYKETTASGNVYTVTMTDGTTYEITAPKGAKGDTGETGATGATGATGNGIASIAKTATVGKADTYTITFTNGSTTTFTVTNGNDGITPDMSAYRTSVAQDVIDAAKANESVVADAYDPTATYAVGDYCIYNNTLYKCNTAIAVAEAWTAAHWTATQIADEFGGAMKIKLAGTAQTPAADGYVDIPLASNPPSLYGDSTPGLLKLKSYNFGWSKGLSLHSGYLVLKPTDAADVSRRLTLWDNPYVLAAGNIDQIIKLVLTDGIGTAWTDTERLAALLRMGCTVDSDGFVKWTSQS